MTNSKETRKEPSLRERRNTLRQLRKGYELSLDELAKMSGLSKSMISKFELGHRNLSASALGRLEDALTALCCERMKNAIGPEDRDYLAYKKFLKVYRDEPKLLRGILLIVHNSQKDIERRDLVVKFLRLVSSKHKNQFIKQWYEAERNALLAFKKIYKLDARFELELGMKLVRRFKGITADTLQGEIRNVRERLGAG